MTPVQPMLLTLLQSSAEYDCHQGLTAEAQECAQDWQGALVTSQLQGMREGACGQVLDRVMVLGTCERADVQALTRNALPCRT